MYIPNSEHYDENGNVTHFGIVDPEHGPILIPNVGGNHGMFTAAYGGGSGAQTLQDGSGGGAGGDMSGANDQPDIPLNPDEGDAYAGGIGASLTNMANGGGSVAAATGAPPPPMSGGSINGDTTDNGPAIDAGGPAGASGTITGPGGASFTPALGNMRTVRDSSSHATVDGAKAADFSKQSELGAQATEAEHAATIAESGVRQAQAEAAANQIAEHQQLQDDARKTYQANVEKKQLEIQAATDKFMNTPIDANHFWADKGTGDKVMAGIAIALGALGGAMSGTNGNVGLDIINKSIERDLKVQELNMQKQGQAIGLKRGLLSDYMNQFGDMEKAKDASFIAYQKGIAQHFESMAMAAKDEGTKANGMKMAAAIRADADMKTMELTKGSVSHETVSQPMGKPKTVDAKELMGLTSMEGAINRNNDIIKIVDKNPDLVGKPAAFMSAVRSTLGMKHDATQLEIQHAIASNLENAYAGTRLMEAKKKLIDQMQGTITMPAEDLMNTLRNENSELHRNVEMQRNAYGASGYILPPSQVKMTTEEKRKRLGVK